MKIDAFNRIRTSLLRAESRCIDHLTELAFQNQPTWTDIHEGFRLVNELKEIHNYAVDAFPFYPSGIHRQAMAALLKRGVITVSQSLVILERIARNHHSAS